METETGAEYISEAHVRHVLRYVTACRWLEPNDYVLDVACGTGYGSKIIARSNRVMGIDSDKDAILEAIKHKPDNCHFIQANIQETIFYGNAIVSIETLEHFSKEDGEKLLKHFTKWLYPGGKLIMSTPYCSKSGPSPITKQHLWEYSLTDFEMVLVNSGFVVEFIKTDRHEGEAGRLGYAMAKAIRR